MAQEGAEAERRRSGAEGAMGRCSLQSEERVQVGDRAEGEEGKRKSNRAFECSPEKALRCYFD